MRKDNNRKVEQTKRTSINDELLMEYWDDAFEEYNNENSGLEDAMMDVFFEICQTKEEWEYLVKKLGEHPSDRSKVICEQRFSNLKVEFKKRPAFLDELKNYEKREQYDLDDQ